MASDNITTGEVLRPGQIDGTGDNLALDQIIFTGSVMAAFQAANKLLGLTRVKELAPGVKGEEFQLIGDVSSHTHQVGEDVLADDFLQAALTGRRKIYADRPEIATTFVDELEDIMSDWDSMEEHSRAIGTALGKRVDQNLFRLLARAARGHITSVYTGEPNNAQIDTTANYDTTGTDTLDKGVYFTGTGTATTSVTWTIALWLTAVLDAKLAFDDRDLPEDGRILLIRNDVMQRIFSTTVVKDLIDQDYTTSVNGTVQKGEIGMLYGFRIMKSNNWPTDDYTDQTSWIGGSTGEGNDYRCDFTRTLASVGVEGANTLSFCFLGSALGTVRTRNISVEVHETWRNQGEAMLGKYIMGHNVLRPNQVVEIQGRQYVANMLAKAS